MKKEKRKKRKRVDPLGLKHDTPHTALLFYIKLWNLYKTLKKKRVKKLYLFFVIAIVRMILNYEKRRRDKAKHPTG